MYKFIAVLLFAVGILAYGKSVSGSDPRPQPPKKGASFGPGGTGAPVPVGGVPGKKSGN